MKKLSVALLALGLLPSAAHAALTASQITTMNIKLYGMYTSADPTCQTGLTPTLPLNANPTVENLSTGPTLGTGPVSSSINCVVFILKNTVTYGWPAGTYSTTTNSNSDGVCNAGGSLDQIICHGNTTQSYPAQISTDAAAVGITLATSCPNSATGNEIVAVYVSTDSACIGQPLLDPGSCSNGGGNTNDAFAAPTAAGDTAHGCKLTAPAAGAASYTLVIDPAGSVGNDGGNCSSVAPPIFTLR